MVVLLRTLTRKSIIGFSKYTDITVQNLLDMSRHYELIELYYFFRNITFTEDVLQEIGIDESLRIDKTDKNRGRYSDSVNEKKRQALQNVINKRTQEEEIVAKKNLMKNYKMKVKMDRLSMNKGFYTKAYLQAKNQGRI